jgi:putative transposase
MLWKATPTGWVKGVWWDLKDVKRRLEKGGGLVPRDFAKRRNLLVPWPVACAVWASLKTLKAGNKWPAVLARATLHDPRQGAL